jgi:hypothetical protein
LIDRVLPYFFSEWEEELIGVVKEVGKGGNRGVVRLEISSHNSHFWDASYSSVIVGVGVVVDPQYFTPFRSILVLRYLRLISVCVWFRILNPAERFVC